MEEQKVEQVEKTSYICSECKKEFRNPQALKMHINWKHKNKPTALIIEDVEVDLNEEKSDKEEKSGNTLFFVSLIVGAIALYLLVANKRKSSNYL